MITRKRKRIKTRNVCIFLFNESTSVLTVEDERGKWPLGCRSPTYSILVLFLICEVFALVSLSDRVEFLLLVWIIDLNFWLLFSHCLRPHLLRVFLFELCVHSELSRSIRENLSLIWQCCDVFEYLSIKFQRLPLSLIGRSKFDNLSVSGRGPSLHISLDYEKSLEHWPRLWS